MYSSHCMIIQCVGFKSIIMLLIWMDDASSSKIFNEFDYLFLSNVLLV